MKKFIVLLISIFSVAYGMAQSFAPVGAKWYYSQHTINPYYETYTTFESVADTVVNGQSCRRLIKTERLSPVGINTSELYMYSDSKRVYFLQDTTWCLLYDFNVQQGDTFRLDCFFRSNGQPVVVTIASVDTVTINGHQRKRFNYLAGDVLVEFTGIVIEGIGHMIDMFPTYENYKRGPLRCYEDNDIGVYKGDYYSGSTCDQIFTGIDKQIVNDNLKIFPNPFHNQLTFLFTDNLQTTISIFNSFGQQILQQSFINFAIINTDQLTAGIYFYKLSSDKGTIKTGKVLKQ